MNTCDLTDAARAALEIMQINASGHTCAKPIDAIVATLNELGFQFTKKKFQQTIMKELRATEHFVGWSADGIFLVYDEESARVCDRSYTDRIGAEMHHQNRLRAIAHSKGWNIAQPSDHSSNEQLTLV